LQRENKSTNLLKLSGQEGVQLLHLLSKANMSSALSHLVTIAASAVVSTPSRQLARTVDAEELINALKAADTLLGPTGTDTAGSGPSTLQEQSKHADHPRSGASSSMTRVMEGMKVKEVLTRALVQQAGSGARFSAGLVARTVAAIKSYDSSAAAALIDMAATEMLVNPGSTSHADFSDLLRAAAAAKHMSPALMQAATAVVRRSEAGADPPYLETYVSHHIVRSCGKLHALAPPHSPNSFNTFSSSSSAHPATLTLPQIALWAAGACPDLGTGSRAQPLVSLLDAVTLLVPAPRCPAWRCRQGSYPACTLNDPTYEHFHQLSAVAKKCMKGIERTNRVSEQGVVLAVLLQLSMMCQCWQCTRRIHGTAFQSVACAGGVNQVTFVILGAPATSRYPTCHSLSSSSC
jgi:hypothetical protein